MKKDKKQNQKNQKRHSSITPFSTCNLIYYQLFFVFALFFIIACQADKPIEESASEIAPLPPPSEDYETNPYQWGFINQTGTLVITDQFDEVRAFSEGLALVRQNGYWGYVGLDGRLAIPCKYRAAWSFSNGLARIQNDDGKVGYIQPPGQLLLEPSWVEANNFKEGLACVRVHNQYGFINTTGQLVIEAIYERFASFTDGYAVVKKQEGYGLIDEKGKEIIPCVYQRLKPFSNDLARASQNKKYGFLNKQGQWAIKPKFIQAADFENELAPAFDGKHWGLINKKGDWTLTPSYNQLYWAAHNRWIAETNSVYQLIDEKATVLADNLEEIHPFTENLAPYKKRELWGFLDREGQVIVPPLYSLVWSYHDGLARVATEYGLSYIDTVGFLLMEPNPNYLELQEFNEGLAPVQVYRSY